MINLEEEKQIDDYLILNRLPLDILLEVRDHMISQISHIQVREGLSFDEAFSKTKIAWEGEFKMTKYSIFFSEEIPIIFKKIIRTNNYRILRRALLIALFSFVVNLLLIYFSPNEETYKVFFKIQNGLFIIIPVFLLSTNYRIWKYIKVDFKYKGKILYSMYQQNLGLMIVGISTMAQIITNNGASIYHFLKGDPAANVISVLITMIFPFLMQTFVTFGILNFFEHKKSLKKLQSFIGSSEAS